MCSEFMVNTTSREVQDALGTPLRIVGQNSDTEIAWNKTIKFSTSAPIIRMTDGNLELVERIFPVSPFPNSRLSGFANQTDGKDTEDSGEDRQIRRIYEMPRWKKSFSEEPYLVPMTGFTEYAYWGSEKGSALKFTVPTTKVFFAAAIALKPFVPKSGLGFSILTHTATLQMLEYHQRLIVLLKPESAAQYLEEMSPQQRFDFLIENRYTAHLEVNKTRTMAKGWEKRVSQQTAKLERETAYRETLTKEQVEG